MTPHTEEMLKVYTDFLNAWHAAQDDEDCRVTRAMYDEYEDPPYIIFEHTEATKVIALHCNPYHDEGGPTVLTGFFEDESRYGDGVAKWVLTDMIQEFDTMRLLIYRESKLEGLPE